MAFMGHKGGDSGIDEHTENLESTEHSQDVKNDSHQVSPAVADKGLNVPTEKENEASESKAEKDSYVPEVLPEESLENKAEREINLLQTATSLHADYEVTSSLHPTQQDGIEEIKSDHLPSEDSKSKGSISVNQTENKEFSISDKLCQVGDSHLQESQEVEVSTSAHSIEKDPKNADVERSNNFVSSETENMTSYSLNQSSNDETTSRESNSDLQNSVSISQASTMNFEPEQVEVKSQERDVRIPSGEHPSESKMNETEVVEPDSEVKKLQKEMKMMEAALQGAARQAQVRSYIHIACRIYAHGHAHVCRLSLNYESNSIVSVSSRNCF